MKPSLEIAQALVANDKQRISKIYLELVAERNKLDKWFNKYLDMFSEKMSEVDRTDPIWKLYNIKSKQYSELNAGIKTAEFYLK